MHFELIKCAVCFISSVSSSVVGLLKLRLEVLGHVKLFSLSSTLQDGQIVCNKLKHFMVKVHLTMSLLPLIQPTPVTSPRPLSEKISERDLGTRLTSNLIPNPNLRDETRDKDMLWDRNRRQSNMAVARKHIQGFLLGLPVFYHWAMTSLEAKHETVSCNPVVHTGSRKDRWPFEHNLYGAPDPLATPSWEWVGAGKSNPSHPWHHTREHIDI